MNSLTRTRKWVPIALVTGTVALVGCGGSKSTGETETTAGKVDAERTKALDKLDESAKLVEAFKEKIPTDVANRSRCVVSIPSMAKGGLVVGAAGGSGYATCKTSTGWSAPTPVSIGGGTFGAQLGYQETDLLALVTSAKGMAGLASGDLKVGADASATAGPVGTGRGASTDVATNADIVSYSRSKGLFAGAELNGTVLKLDQDPSKALYGEGQSTKSLLSGSVAAPSAPSAQRFSAAVRSVFGDGKIPGKS